MGIALIVVGLFYYFIVQGIIDPLNQIWWDATVAIIVVIVGVVKVVRGGKDNYNERRDP